MTGPEQVSIGSGFNKLDQSVRQRFRSEYQGRRYLKISKDKSGWHLESVAKEKKTSFRKLLRDIDKLTKNSPIIEKQKPIIGESMAFLYDCKVKKLDQKTGLCGIIGRFFQKLILDRSFKKAYKNLTGSSISKDQISGMVQQAKNREAQVLAQELLDEELSDNKKKVIPYFRSLENVLKELDTGDMKSKIEAKMLADIEKFLDDNTADLDGTLELLGRILRENFGRGDATSERVHKLEGQIQEKITGLRTTSQERPRSVERMTLAAQFQRHLGKTIEDVESALKPLDSQAVNKALATLKGKADSTEDQGKYLDLMSLQRALQALSGAKRLSNEQEIILRNLGILIKEVGDSKPV
ncbi:MAG: hypothetical protein ACQEP8_00520 [Chlamydiota bacterium]